MSEQGHATQPTVGHLFAEGNAAAVIRTLDAVVGITASDRQDIGKQLEATRGGEIAEE